MRKYTLNKTTKLYHLSFEKMDGKVLYPRIPDSRATNENETVPRVCFSTSIIGCIKAICADNLRCSIYVYEPSNAPGYKYIDNLFVPTKEDVPDVIETREKWITCPVKMKLSGVVHIQPKVYNDCNYKFTKITDTNEVVSRNIFNYPVVLMDEYEKKIYDKIMKDLRVLYENFMSNFLDEEHTVGIFKQFYMTLAKHYINGKFRCLGILSDCLYPFDGTAEYVLSNRSCGFWSFMRQFGEDERFECIEYFAKQLIKYINLYET